MGNPDPMCGICMDKLIEDGEQPEFLACGHGFHAYCLGEWMKARKWATIEEARCRFADRVVLRSSQRMVMMRLRAQRLRW